MGVTLEEVIENNLLSPAVLECIPETCECGGLIEFTDSLKQIYCSNPKCIYKVAARLEAMAKKMKADGFGESTCQTLCREFNLVSPYQIFLFEDAIKTKGITSEVSAFEKKIASICDPEKRKVELWQVVQLAGIPSIETISYKIFNGYDNLTEAFNDIENGQVPFIAEKLGLKNSETGVMATNVYKTLKQYKEELLFGETQFNIYKPTGETLYIAITGGVYGFRNKSEYINYINMRYDGKVNAMLMNTVTYSIDALVADGDTSSNKFRTAHRLNEKYVEKAIQSGEINPDMLGVFLHDTDLHPVGEKILITTSDGLIARLDARYKSSNNSN